MKNIILNTLVVAVFILLSGKAGIQAQETGGTSSSSFVESGSASQFAGAASSNAEAGGLSSQFAGAASSNAEAGGLSSQVGGAASSNAEAGIPVAWEELTSGDFVEAAGKSGGVCLIPMGVIEKHGAHLPMGTDVYTAREISLRAAEMEYAVVFPFYYAGQIFEAMHQPGTIAYSPELLYNLLDETCKEISRNGLNKIILVNGHGGNNSFLKYFCQTQLSQEKDYTVFLYTPQMSKEVQEKISGLRSSKTGGHADEVETGVMLYIRPDLVKLERADDESGADLNRFSIPNAYTGIWWYGKYPNHYAGDAKDAVPQIGELSVNFRAKQLRDVIKAVKHNNSAKELQDSFFKESANPLSTIAK